MVNYIPVTQIQFNANGYITSTMVNGQTLSTQNNIPNPNARSGTKNIYELQKDGYQALADYLDRNRGRDVPIPTNEEPLNKYLNAITQVIQYNYGTATVNLIKAGPLTTAPTPTGTNVIVFGTASTDMNAIFDAYNTLLQKRNDIKEKLKNIYSAPGSLNGDYTNQYTTTLYANTLVAILATSLLYLVFIHLK